MKRDLDKTIFMQAKAALLDALPCLMDLIEQSDSQMGQDHGGGRGFSFEYLFSLFVHSTFLLCKEYNEELLESHDAQKVVHCPYLFLRYMVETHNREAIAEAAIAVTCEELLQCKPDVAR